MAKRIETFAVDRRGDLVRQVVRASLLIGQLRGGAVGRRPTRGQWLYARGARS